MPVYETGQKYASGDENGSHDNLRLDPKLEGWSSIPRMVRNNTGLITMETSHFYDLEQLVNFHNR